MMTMNWIWQSFVALTTFFLQQLTCYQAFLCHPQLFYLASFCSCLNPGKLPAKELVEKQ